MLIMRSSFIFIAALERSARGRQAHTIVSGGGSQDQITSVTKSNALLQLLAQ
jgi:hypothetical protein